LLGELENAHAGIDLALLADSKPVDVDPCAIGTIESGSYGREIARVTYAAKSREPQYDARIDRTMSYDLPLTTSTPCSRRAKACLLSGLRVRARTA
jgi:hypothetical protein